MIGHALFSIYYPAHAAALRGTQGLLVEGIGSSLDNLNQGAFQDLQPPSAFYSLWGRLDPSLEIPVQRLFRSNPAAAAAAFLVSQDGGRSVSGPGRGIEFSGKDEEGTGVAADIGIPTLPGTRPGAETFDALVHALAEAGLATNPDSPNAELLGTVWLKAPDVTSGPIESLEALRHAYYHMVVKEVASQATVEKYVPGAVVVEVDLSAGPEGEFQVLSIALKKRTRVTSETPALETSDLPEGKNQILFQAAKAIARKAGATGAITVKFLFDPSSKEVFFLKLK
ncbi:MAG TPA: hypothetical protein VFX30_13050 [bacterium]|nr:hypothetical protein [bacterium]